MNRREVGHDINVQGVWSLNITGKGVVVAVVDDGQLSSFHTQKLIILSSPTSCQFMIYRCGALEYRPCRQLCKSEQVNWLAKVNKFVFQNVAGSYDLNSGDKDPSPNLKTNIDNAHGTK